MATERRASCEPCCLSPQVPNRTLVSIASYYNGVEYGFALTLGSKSKTCGWWLGWLARQSLSGKRFLSKRNEATILRAEHKLSYMRLSTHCHYAATHLAQSHSVRCVRGVQSPARSRPVRLSRLACRAAEDDDAPPQLTGDWRDFRARLIREART
jgi:hypothetical protein